MTDVFVWTLGSITAGGFLVAMAVPSFRQDFVDLADHLFEAVAEGVILLVTWPVRLIAARKYEATHAIGVSAESTLDMVSAGRHVQRIIDPPTVELTEEDIKLSEEELAEDFSRFMIGLHGRAKFEEEDVFRLELSAT